MSGSWSGCRSGSTTNKRYYRALLPSLLPLPCVVLYGNPTRKIETTAGAVVPAVLPPIGGTTALAAVLPLSTRHPLFCTTRKLQQAGRQHGWKENVYVMIPPILFRNGSPLDSTVIPTTQFHRKETKENNPSKVKSSRGNNRIVPLY